MREIEVLFPEPIKLKWKNKEGKEESLLIEELDVKRISHVCMRIGRLVEKIFGNPEISKSLKEKGLEKDILKSAFDVKIILGALIEVAEKDMFEIAADLMGKDYTFVENLRSVQIVTKYLLLAYEINKEILLDSIRLRQVKILEMRPA